MPNLNNPLNFYFALGLHCSFHALLPYIFCCHISEQWKIQKKKSLCVEPFPQVIEQISLCAMSNQIANKPIVSISLPFGQGKWTNGWEVYSVSSSRWLWYLQSLMLVWLCRPFYIEDPWFFHTIIFDDFRLVYYCYLFLFILYIICLFCYMCTVSFNCIQQNACACI